MSQQITIQKPQIMVIGWFNEKYSCEGLSQGFEELGFEVIRVATDWTNPSQSGKFNHHVLQTYATIESERKHELEEAYHMQCHWHRFKIKWLSEQYPKLQWILIIQCDLTLDIRDVGVPVFYYYTETTHPRMPFGQFIDGLFYAFVGGKQRLQNSHPYEKAFCFFETMIPHGFQTQELPPKLTPYLQRKHKIGFKGLRFFNARSGDPLEKYMYLERGRFLNYLKQTFPNDYTEEGHDTWENYKIFMNETQIAINIPGIDGCINQRQFEAWGFGCLLVQYYYPEIETLGFRGKHFGQNANKDNDPNCLFFQNETQLALVIRWALKNPKAAAKIAMQGKKDFALLKCSWQDRAKQMYDVIRSVDWEIVTQSKKLMEHENDMMEKQNKRFEKLRPQIIKVSQGESAHENQTEGTSSRL